MPDGYYDSWDLTPPPILPHSRLYPLEPKGIGTSAVESLTSYTARLAEAHCLSIGALFMREIAPLLDRTYLNTSHNIATFIGTAAQTISSIGAIAEDWVRSLETLTMRNDLRYLSLLTWKNTLSAHSLIRRSLAWCPICLENERKAGQVIYEPLLWAFQDITVCTLHDRELDHVCPHCKKQLRIFRLTSRPGYCSNCRNWLGSSEGADLSNRIVITKEWEYRVWVANAIGELLSNATVLPFRPSKERIAVTTSYLIDRVAEGNPSLFARLVYT